MVTKVVAHKGNSKDYPENTIAAFDSAIDLGADAIEFDVHQSSDGHLVIHHDYLLGNTCSGTGLIYERDLRYLKSQDVGSWYGRNFLLERMPLLDEVLARYGEKILYEIELKGFTETFISNVIRKVSKHELLHRVEFTSPHSYVLSYIRKLLPEVNIGCFVESYPSWMPATLGEKIALNKMKLERVNVAHCSLKILNTAFIRALKSENIKVHAANCNTHSEIQVAFSKGVNQLSTSMPRLAIQIRQARRCLSNDES